MWAATSSICVCIVRCLLSPAHTHTQRHTRHHLHCRAAGVAAAGDPVLLHVSGGQWTELPVFFVVFIFCFLWGAPLVSVVCALNFGFVFISCVIFVSLQYQKKKKNKRKAKEKHQQNGAYYYGKRNYESSPNEPKKKVFRNGRQLSQGFFFIFFKRKWK